MVTETKSVLTIEVESIALLFALLVILMEPLRNFLIKHLPSVPRFLQRKIMLPRPIRIVALLLAVICTLIVAFWMAADVLGGLNGYGYSFNTHPYLPLIYNAFDLRYINLGSVGATNSLLFSLAFLCLIVVMLNRGISTAVKDSMTLFAAPILIVFELTLWYYAAPDMYWHVASFLYIGGVYDGGFISRSAGGYIFSNWFVLIASMFFMASRVPWLSLPSKILWRREKPKMKIRLIEQAISSNDDG